jgi:putative transposase
MARKSEPHDPFRWTNSSPQVFQLMVMLYVRYPLSPRNVEDLAFDRCIEICHETVRKWGNRFGPAFAAKCRPKHYGGWSADRRSNKRFGFSLAV